MSGVSVELNDPVALRRKPAGTEDLEDKAGGAAKSPWSGMTARRSQMTVQTDLEPVDGGGQAEEEVEHLNLLGLKSCRLFSQSGRFFWTGVLMSYVVFSQVIKIPFYAGWVPVPKYGTESTPFLSWHSSFEGYRSRKIVSDRLLFVTLHTTIGSLALALVVVVLFHGKRIRKLSYIFFPVSCIFAIHIIPVRQGTPNRIFKTIPMNEILIALVMIFSACGFVALSYPKRRACPCACLRKWGLSLSWIGVTLTMCTAPAFEHLGIIRNTCHKTSLGKAMSCTEGSWNATNGSVAIYERGVNVYNVTWPRRYGYWSWGQLHAALGPVGGYVFFVGMLTCLGLGVFGCWRVQRRCERSAHANVGDGERLAPTGRSDSSRKLNRGTAVVLSRRPGAEPTIDIIVVLEEIRFAAYVTFLAVIALGYVLTRGFSEVDLANDSTFLARVFGNTNVCIYFDLVPSTYILPGVYTITIVCFAAFAFFYILRAWIAWQQGKISHRGLRAFVAGIIYVALSVCYFQTIFSVAPDPSLPYTMIIHSAPFVNLEMSLVVLQICTVWLGRHATWEKDVPRWFRVGSVVHTMALGFVTTAKMLFQINALADMGDAGEGRGKWWSVRNPSAIRAATFFDLTWLALGFVIPLMQAWYLRKRGHAFNTLRLSVRDGTVTTWDDNPLNRRA